MVAAFGYLFTTAYFSDTETSEGNLFQAGAIDLKVDHTYQSYNGIDCRTCRVVLISDETNMVVEKNGEAIEPPYPAVFLNPIHSAWTAQNDPLLQAAGAQWIWEQNPVKQEDTTVDTIYTFEKQFTWFGSVTGSDFTMAVGHDNTVKVYLNDILVGDSDDIYGFQLDHMLHIAGTNITDNLEQGNNVLRVELRNRAEPNGNPQNNPAGLIYKFEINGNCGDDFFLNYCKLWSEKDLVEGDLFWNFDDVKPGDSGKNGISLHVYDNDAYACMTISGEDVENVMLPVEEIAGDEGEEEGELSQFLQIFLWHDTNNDGIYDPPGETMIYQGPLANAPITLFEPPTPMVASTTYIIGTAWCFGTQNVDPESGIITCDGTGDHNIAQTDKFLADVEFYVEQARNNPDFTCQPPINDVTD